MDPLAEAMNTIKVFRNAGKDECNVPASKLIKEVLSIMKGERYIKEFEFVDDGRAGYYTVRGIGPVNECKPIKPRFNIKSDEIEKYEKQYLLSPDFGVMIISTTKGVLTSKEARKHKIGGRLIAYIY